MRIYTGGFVISTSRRPPPEPKPESRRDRESPLPSHAEVYAESSQRTTTGTTGGLNQDHRLPPPTTVSEVKEAESPQKGPTFKELPSPSPRALPNLATKHHNETTLYTAQSLPRKSKAGDHYHSEDGTIPETKRRTTIGGDDAWPGSEKKRSDI
ncbi:hypothetical protein Rs2_50421 [Raphanus sativus]|nr:hypothetical protein Rs2_50421 [Raphanus sativus]